MRLGEQSYAIRSDLVGRVAVGRDAVGANEYKLYPPLLHDLSGHAVADECHIDAAHQQLPGSQAGALEQRPGLIGIDLEAATLFGGREEYGQRGAVVSRGQTARIAVS